MGGWLCRLPEQRELHGTSLAVISRRAENKAQRRSARIASLLRPIPEKWWHYRPHPTNGYMFAHGSQVFEERQPT